MMETRQCETHLHDQYDDFLTKSNQMTPQIFERMAV
jgi:hypothetical protein